MDLYSLLSECANPTDRALIHGIGLFIMFFRHLGKRKVPVKNRRDRISSVIRRDQNEANRVDRRGIPEYSET